jgi:predicted 3-demethylubiquinone-9 3-methyltransferase (glyoxalase superfamily)
MQKITNFMMFEGNAEEAMNFYLTLFDNSKVERVLKYGPNQGGTEGSVMHAKFTLSGQQFMCIDSAVHHQFTFTPAMSLYVDCESEEEVEKLVNALSAGGNILMPLNTYPFAKKYAWISDKFGVSWQLSYNK